jgi:hypothetical protein
VRPTLPLTGSYEIFAWGCGDPNHDQVWQTTVMIYPFRSGFYAVPSVQVNLKEDAGRWISLGTWHLNPGASLSIGAGEYGNVAVDAFKFVYVSSEQVNITPTPAPTPVTWTNHPPSPEEQMTSGDLSARLGLVHLWYAHAPTVQPWEEKTFDDCAAFPRPGCGGERAGWRIGVDYQARDGFSVVYRVSQDRQFVALEASEELKQRQLLYLSGYNAGRVFYVYRYPDGAWRLVSHAPSGAGSSGPLAAEHLAALLPLVDRYASIGTSVNQVVSADGWEQHLYGLGGQVALSDEDRARLEALGEELGRLVLP